MRTIYKYPIPRESNNAPFEVELPHGGEVLYFNVDPKIDSPCMWAQVRTDRELVKRSFILVGTGYPIPPNAGMYYGSCVDGPYVWHLYSIRKE